MFLPQVRRGAAALLSSTKRERREHEVRSWLASAQLRVEQLEESCFQDAEGCPFVPAGE